MGDLAGIPANRAGEPGFQEIGRVTVLGQQVFLLLFQSGYPSGKGLSIGLAGSIMNQRPGMADTLQRYFLVQGRKFRDPGPDFGLPSVQVGHCPLTPCLKD